MGISARNKWLSISLLAIILPISTLAALKFSGILREPAPLETITQNAVNWAMERPSYHATIDHTVENEYVTNEIRVGMHVYVWTYYENALAPPYNGRDGICLGVGVNITILKGFGVYLVVKGLPTEGNSTLYISMQFSDLCNVSIVKMKQISDLEEAYLKAYILSLSSFAQMQCYWTFNNDALENQTITISFEVLYFDGTVYQKIVSPFNLSVFSGSTMRD